MIRYLTLILILFSNIAFGQTIKLTDYIIYPRLDSTYWENDFDLLNSSYSKNANRCQTCVYTQTDTTRGRFCFNTSLGHVKLDTSLHDFSPDKLIGHWKVINYGTIEITDSILSNSKIYFRKENILNEQSQDLGEILFSDKRIKTELKNIKEIPNQNKRYKILDRKYLATKRLSGYCGATFIGLTKEGYLILDDLTFRTIAYKGNYLVVITTIRRMILKKRPHNNI